MEKKFLHLFINNIISFNYIKFINKNFDENNHTFIFENLGDSDTEIRILKNVKELYEGSSKTKIGKMLEYYHYFIFFSKEIKKYDRLYIHGLFSKKMVIFLFLFKKNLNKVNWVVWGGDLHSCENRRKEIIHKFYYRIEDYVKKNISFISTLVPGDYELAKQFYNVRGKYCKAIYPAEINFNKIENLKEKKSKEIFIQIGNSGNPSNNHFEILESLKKFRNKDIKIYAILSYAGSKEYINKVIKYGDFIFGNKFIPIINFMFGDEYWQYLKSIDILVLNHHRQQGLGNIERLSYLEKKIYLRSDTSSWDYLVNDLKLKLNPYESIKDQTFEEFIKNNATGNKDIIKKILYCKSYQKKVWEDNFKN